MGWYKIMSVADSQAIYIRMSLLAVSSQLSRSGRWVDAPDKQICLLAKLGDLRGSARAHFQPQAWC